VNRLLFRFLPFFCAVVIGSNNAIADETQTVLRVESSVLRIVSLDKNNRPIGLGSGFAVDKDGHLATNHHVIDGAARVLVAIKGSDGKPRLIDGAVIWSSAEVDLAFVRVASGTVPGLQIAGVAPRKAEKVFALGYPYSADLVSRGAIESPQFVEATATNGSIGRIIFEPFVSGGQPVELIQHSAPINVGNSGGPLFDNCGRVIGVNTGKAISTLENDQIDVTTGIYFASSSRVLLAAAENAQIKLTSESDLCSIATPRSRFESAVGFWYGPVGIGAILAAFLLALALFFREAQAKIRSGKVAERSTGDFIGDSPSNALSTQKTDHLSLEGSDSLGFPLSIPLSYLMRSDNSLYLGRSMQEAQAIISDKTVSRRHLRIHRSGEVLWVTDCGSKNGTAVNGRLIGSSPTRLFVGDEIRLGSVLLRLIRNSS
jgi:hypothetical protein